MVLAVPQSILVYPTTPTYRADTTAWLAVATDTYSTAEKQALDSLLAGLDADGILKFDRIWLLHFGKNAADALRCIVSLQSATTVSSPTFTQGQGFSGTTSTGGYINTGWTPNQGVHFQTNDACFGVFVRKVSTQANIFRMFGGATSDTSSTSGMGIGMQTNDSSALYRLNQNGTVNADISVLAKGNTYCSVSRQLLTETQARRGSTQVTLATTGTDRANRAMYLLARNFGGTPDGRAPVQQISIAWVGAGQSATGWGNCRSRLDTFNAAIGFVNS